MEDCSVYFEPNKNKLTGSWDACMTMVAEYVNNTEGTRIMVSGHTDKKFQEQLGLLRTQKIKDVLVRQYKVSRKNIGVESKGYTDTAINSDIEEMAKQNRRAVISEI